MMERTIENMIEQELADLHTATPARIDSFDPERMTATVTILYKVSGVTLPPVIEVPVACMKAGPFVIRPPYAVGDIVLVIFTERALDYILSLTPQEVQCKGRHRIDDAVIVSGLKIDSQENLQNSFAEDLLIVNIQTNDYVVLKKTGGIEVNSTQAVQITSAVSIELSAPQVNISASDRVNISDSTTRWDT